MGWHVRIDQALHEHLEQAVREGLLAAGSTGYAITQQVI